MPHPSDRPLPLSALLRGLYEQTEPTISIDELMTRFGGRAMGGLLLIFGLICALPLPPGGTTIFGAPLLLLAPQLALSSRRPWLPKRLRARTIAVSSLRRGLPRALWALQLVEAVSRPRLTLLFSPPGERFIGLVCTVLALVLILPIPLGNMLPAATVSVLALSLIQRDGILALAGFVLAGLSGGVLILAANLIIKAAHGFFDLLPIA